MENEITVTAAIVTYNTSERTFAACESILNQTKRYPIKLYVIDNASTDGTENALSQLIKSGEITYLKQNKNLGFGAAHNLMLKETLGKYHFVINPDILLCTDAISDMIDYMEKNPDVLMMMPKILNSDGSEQKLPKEIPTAKRLFFGRLAGHGSYFDKIRNEYIHANQNPTEATDIDFCSGCFFCIRSEIFCKLSGFDTRFFMYLEDADLTQRVKAFGRVVFNPNIEVIHEWQRTSAKNIKYLLIHIISCIKFLNKKRKEGF